MQHFGSGPHRMKKAQETYIFGPRRSRIREDLRRFLKEAKLSFRSFASLLHEEGINTNEAAIRRFLDLNAGRVSNAVVLAVEAFLDKHVRPQWEKDGLSEPTAPAASLFEVAQAFFGMGQHKVRQYHDSVPGTYRFYAYSERGRNAVCLGAIRFNEDFSVEELQTNSYKNGSTISERFLGYYIYRRDSLFVILHNQERREPKIYILAIPSYNDEHVKRQSLTGLLLRMGEERPVFGSAIHMVRDANAFAQTEVIARRQVDAGILRILDSRQWLPN